MAKVVAVAVLAGALLFSSFSAPAFAGEDPFLETRPRCRSIMDDHGSRCGLRGDTTFEIFYVDWETGERVSATWKAKAILWIDGTPMLIARNLDTTKVRVFPPQFPLGAGSFRVVGVGEARYTYELAGDSISRSTLRSRLYRGEPAI